MVICFAFDCKHRSGVKNTCRFFRFPTDPGKRKQWWKLCRRADKEPTTQNDRICSCHFKHGKKDGEPCVFAWNEDKYMDLQDLGQSGSGSDRRQRKECLAQAVETTTQHTPNTSPSDEEMPNAMVSKEVSQMQSTVPSDEQMQTTVFLNRLYAHSANTSPEDEQMQTAQLDNQLRPDSDYISLLLDGPKKVALQSRSDLACTGALEAQDGVDRRSKISDQSRINAGNSDRVIGKMKSVHRKHKLSGPVKICSGPAIDIGGIRILQVQSKCSIKRHDRAFSDFGSTERSTGKTISVHCNNKSRSTTEVPDCPPNNLGEGVFNSRRSVHRKEFYSMKQIPGQTFHEYVTILRRKAAQCDFNVQCSNGKCSQMVSYAEQMVADLLAVGSSDERLAKHSNLGTQQTDHPTHAFVKCKELKRPLDNQPHIVQAAQTHSQPKQKKISLLRCRNDVNYNKSDENQVNMTTRDIYVVKSERELRDTKEEMNVLFTVKGSESHHVYVAEKNPESIDQRSTNITPSLAGDEALDFTSTDQRAINLRKSLASQCDQYNEKSSASEDQCLDSVPKQPRTESNEAIEHVTKPHSDRQNQCKICELSCDTSEELHKHIKTHTGEESYECSVCGKCFSHSNLLNMHMKLHPGEKTYKCSECGKIFGKNFLLVRHMRIHSGEKPFQCTECGMCFNQVSNLTHHMRIHTGEKPFECSECAKRFRRSDTLILHRRTHTGEKSCVCEICGLRLSGTSQLSRHIRTHTGEKPYKCTLCEKSFIAKEYLTKHLRTHSGEKPYQCDECGRCFTQRSNFKGHKCVHSREKT